MSETATIQQGLLDTFYQLSLPQQKELLDFAEFLRQKTAVNFSPKVNHHLLKNQANWQALIRETTGAWQDMPTSQEIRAGWDHFTLREEL
jgi:protein associated with RNAse G/E